MVKTKTAAAAVGDPLGPKELAEFLGVKRATVQQWRFRQVLPAEDYRINGGPAWERQTIIEWAIETGRLDPADKRARR